jgi:dihydropyrimidinase
VSEPVDLVLRNGWIVNSGGRMHGSVAVRGERIAWVGPDEERPRAHRVIDAEERIVLPGLIDPHVHLTSEEDASIPEGIEANLPGESRGMLAGGVTSFGHFVGAAGRKLVPQIQQTIEGIDSWSHVDCFLHAFVFGAETLEEQDDAWQLGVTSFKHFYTAYGRRQLEDAGLGRLFAPVDNDVLLPSMRWVAARGAPGLVMVHAEDGDVVDVHSAEVAATGRRDLAAWSDGRPSIAEWTRVQQAVAFAAHTRAPLYIVHLTTAEAAAIVAAARADGVRVAAETGPQWLTHHGGMEDDIGCWGKVNPPLRSPDDVQALWRALQAGTISCLGTDHGTGGRTAATKEKGGGKHANIWAARPGIRGGSEHMLPVLMTYGVHTGALTVEDLVRVTSTETARIFGLYPQKGAIVPGADADLVIVDPDREAVVDEHFYQSLCEVSIYEGRRLRGLAHTTVVRGKVSMDAFEPVSAPGWGRYLPRGAAAHTRQRRRVSAA